MFQVLKPEYHLTGERLADGRAVYRVEWVRLGTANSMEDARRLHPFPILEPVTRLH